MKGHPNTSADPNPEMAQKKLDGFVYRVPGPEGKEDRWIARSVHGHVAHGRSPESAARNLEAGLRALAEASGQTFAEWQFAQNTDGARFLQAGELVQA